MTSHTPERNRIRKILIANRSEIAIRVMRAAAELDIRTVAIYAAEGRFALHRFKADESYLVSEGKKPIAAYLDVDRGDEDGNDAQGGACRRGVCCAHCPGLRGQRQGFTN